jgi:hypothetical protein
MPDVDEVANPFMESASNVVDAIFWFLALVFIASLTYALYKFRNSIK